MLMPMANDMMPPPLNNAVGFTTVEPRPNCRNRGSHNRSKRILENWNIVRTRHELLVDWNDIKDCSDTEARAGFQQIMAFSKEAGVDEFVVENIAPGYKVGVDDPAIVLEVQASIASIFMNAVAKYVPEWPEYRLTRRREVFDIRFYLGQTRPIDCHVPDDDY